MVIVNILVILVIMGIYHEWSQSKEKSLKCQRKRMRIYCEQIDAAKKSENNLLIILGDANLDINKVLKYLAQPQVQF